jgi:flagellar basal-body rod modification protein FlgD
MAVLPPVNNSTSSGRSSTSSASSDNAINQLDMNSFLKLMITELQQQDPMNPMDNKDMLDQIAQIRAVGASDQLTTTLKSVLLGQNITSATNLIGADVSALTDDGQSITGTVNRVAIDKGVPKIHVENSPGVMPSTADGNVDAGTHSYRVVWSGDNNQMLGMDFSGANAIATTGKAGVDKSVLVQGLPVTNVPKYVYRTDKSGTGSYQLVGVISDGQQGSIVDNAADADRNGQTLTQSFQSVATTPREYDIGLNNVSAIRPPSY